MDDTGKIEEIVSLGVPRDLAQRALTVSGGDVGRAVNAYYDGLVTTNQYVPYPYHHQRPYVASEKDVDMERLKELEKKFSIRFRGSPIKILPTPNNKEEYLKMMGVYEREKEDRKTEFLRKTMEGYFTARIMYAKGLSQVFFNALLDRESLPDFLGASLYGGAFDLSYQEQRWKGNLKKVVIAARKIAECDFFLGCYNECMSICSCILEVVDRNQMNRKMLKLTYGCMGRVCLQRNELNKAREYIEKGLELDPGSGILQKAEVELEKRMRGDTNFVDMRHRVLMNSKRFEFETFPIHLPLGETIPEVMSLEVEEDEELRRERVSYVLEEEVILKMKDENMVVRFDVKNAFSLVIWKSLVC